MQRAWWIAAATVVLAIGFGIGFVVSDDGHSSSDDHGLGNDRMAVMMADGSMPQQMDDFIVMMKQMRPGMTRAVRSRMDRNAMWELMESGEMMRMMDAHRRRMAGMPGMHADDDMGGPGHGR